MKRSSVILCQKGLRWSANWQIGFLSSRKWTLGHLFSCSMSWGGSQSKVRLLFGWSWRSWPGGETWRRVWVRKEGNCHSANKRSTRDERETCKARGNSPRGSWKLEIYSGNRGEVMMFGKCTLVKRLTEGKQAGNAENQRFFRQNPSVYAVFRLIPPPI